MLLLDFYKEVFQITDEALLDEAVKLSEVKLLKQGDYLFRQGEVPTQMCFLLRGIVRGFMLDINGKDITDCIAFRSGDSVMPDNDFAQPASITMEALCDSEIVCIAIPEVQRLLGEYPALSELYRRLVFYTSNRHRDLKIATFQYTAVQRLQWFLKEYPGVIDQISHKYIASLLNMTPVTLSKMRKILREEKDYGER